MATSSRQFRQKKQLRGHERRQLAIEVITQTNGQADTSNANHEAYEIIYNEKTNIYSNDQVKKV